MYKQATLGDKWGTLTCIYAGFKVFEWEDEDRSGAAGTEKIYVYELKCECGQTKTVKRTEFPGKQKMQDCGCGMGGYGKTVTMTLTVPGGLQQEMARIASIENNGLSATATRMIRWGMERWRKENEAEREIERKRLVVVEEQKKARKQREYEDPFKW